MRVLSIVSKPLRHFHEDKEGGAYLRYGVIFRVSVLREEEVDEVDELDDVEAAEERRAMGAGVGALLRMDSDLFREPDPGCA